MLLLLNDGDYVPTPHVSFSCRAIQSLVGHAVPIVLDDFSKLIEKNAAGKLETTPRIGLSIAAIHKTSCCIISV